MNIRKYQNFEYPKHDSIKEYFDYSTIKNGDKLAYHECINGKEITYKEFRNRVINAAFGLNRLLNGKKTHCAIISENSILYMLTYFSIFNSNNVAVLIDGELNETTMNKQIDYADSEVVFISKKFAKRIDGIKTNCPNVKYIVILSEESDEDYITFNTLEDKGKEDNNKAVDYHNNLIVNSYDLAQILFTSGTTGANKGVMLSNRNICCSVYATMVHFNGGGDTLALLPFFHAYEMSCHVLPIFVYGRTNYINDSLLHMMNNLKKYPAVLTAAVPLVPETMVKKIMSELRKTKSERYFWGGIKLSNILRKVLHIDLREQFFSAILDKFNSNFRYFGCGGAPIKSETYDVLEAMGFHIIAGYGITECAPLVACNYWNYQRKGSAGHIVPNMQVKIDNIREDGNGDILVKGEGVMLGYYKDDESTKKVLSDDGWLNTGDIGHLDNDDFVYICGRTKNLIILPNGKNVYPEEIEELLMNKLTYIDECLVFSDKDETGIFATVYLNTDFTAHKNKEELYKIIKQDLIIFNKDMPSYKRISDIIIRNKEFNKSPTKKILRNESNMIEG